MILRLATLAQLIVPLTLILMESPARSQELFSAKMIAPQRIEAEVSAPFGPYNTNVDAPEISVFEIINSGQTTKTVERPLSHVNKQVTNNHLVVTFDVPAANKDFDHYEVQVRNYKTADDPLTFRGAVYSITVSITSASDKKLSLIIRGLNTTDWQRIRKWIAEVAASGPTVTVDLGAAGTRTLKVTNASYIEMRPDCFPLELGQRYGECILGANLALDDRLPVGIPGTVKLSFPATAFDPQLADNLPLELVKNGVTGKISITPLGAAQDRDPIRTNVIEAGGSFNTSIKLDADPATNKKPDRENQATADLRLASKSVTFADKTRSFWTWTAAQLDAQVSSGKITIDSLSTNTLRGFTQIQHVRAIERKEGIDFFRFVGEGGAAADRDLRVIEYTGLGDLRYNPAILNRVLDRDPLPDHAKRIIVELTPFGFEVGHRQVRRDPLFASDDFIRRFRAAAKLQLDLPPHFQFAIENRCWWRGEVEKDRFRNYFTTSFTIVPGKLSTNSSLGIVLSYDRGSLPPFSTPRESAFKIGLRFRRKEW